MKTHIRIQTANIAKISSLALDRLAEVEDVLKETRGALGAEYSRSPLSDYEIDDHAQKIERGERVAHYPATTLATKLVAVKRLETRLRALAELSKSAMLVEIDMAGMALLTQPAATTCAELAAELGAQVDDNEADMGGAALQAQPAAVEPLADPPPAEPLLGGDTAIEHHGTVPELWDTKAGPALVKEG